MFENLSARLRGLADRLRGAGRFGEDDLRKALADIRRALVEADAALPVVEELLEAVARRARAADLAKRVSPGEDLLAIVRDELAAALGGKAGSLNVNVPPPAVVALVGLQGAGKTSTAAKLAHMLGASGKRVALAACDLRRPAAAEQLRVLAGAAGAEFYPPDGADAAAVADAARARAARELVDVLVLDTAGRLHADEEMMAEAAAVCARAEPIETLFVADCMTGQDALVAARAFDAALPLSGVILTKADGDARGGAALSVRRAIGKPIKLIATGEKHEDLEPFHPGRMASRIFGLGDVAGLAERLGARMSDAERRGVSRLLKKKKAFTLEDMRAQLARTREAGLGALLERLPAGMRAPPTAAAERDVGRTLAVIDSMTPPERRRPEIIKGSRKRRIAAGSGTRVQDVNQVLQRFEQMRKMAGSLVGARARGMLQAMSGGGAGALGAPPGLAMPRKRKRKTKRRR